MCEPHAKIIFTPRALWKTHLLLTFFSSEVAWHGVARRVGFLEYEVSDILVYPQRVTTASVEMDEAAYARWLDALDERGDDRVFHLRMQGHSHVNMPVYPSTVDLAHQEEIMSQLTPDGFYIFMIFNKRWDWYARVCDRREGLLLGPENLRLCCEPAEEMEAFPSAIRPMLRGLIKEQEEVHGSIQIV